MDKVINIDIKVNAPTLKELRTNLAGLEDDVKKATNTSDVKKFDNEIDNLNKSIKEVVDSGADLGASFEEVYGELLPLSTQISEAEDRMYELAKAGKVNSDEFKNLATQTAKNKQIIIETDQAIDDMANNRGLATFGTQIGDIGKSLLTLDFARADKQAKQLAMSAKNINFGDAIGQVKKLGSTFIQLGKALLANPLFLLVAVIVAIGVAIFKLLDKLGVLKVIMNAVGKVFAWIGDLIDALIQPLKDLTDWLGWTANAAEESAQKQADAAEKVAKANENRTQENLIGIDAEIARARIQGKNTEDLERKKVYMISFTAKVRKEADHAAYVAAWKKGELDEKEIAGLKEKARLSRLAYKQSKEDAKTFETQIAQDKKDIKAKGKADTLATTDATNKGVADKNKAAWDARKKQLEEEAKFRASTAKQIKDIQLSIIEDETKRELAINAEKFKRLRDEAAASEKLSKEDKKILDELYRKQELKASQDINKAKADSDIQMQMEVDAILFELKSTVQEQELAAIDASYEAKRQKLIDNATDEFALTEEFNAALLELDKKAEAEKQAYLDAKVEEEKTQDEADLLAKLEKDAFNLEGQRALLEEQKRQELDNAELTGEERLAIEEKYRKLNTDANIAAAQKGLAAASQGLSAIQGLSDAIFANKMSKLEKGSAAEEAAAKKQFEINKKVQIAMAIVQGVQATLAAYSSGSAVPVVGAVTGPLFAALAAATSLANITKIKNSKFEGGGGGGGSAGSPAAGAAAISSASAGVPSFDFFGSGGSSEASSTQSVEAGSSQQNQQPIVVSVEEITSTQGRVAKISESGTL